MSVGEGKVVLKFVCFESQKKRKNCEKHMKKKKEKKKRKERKKEKQSLCSLFAHYFFKNLCFPYPFIVSQYPSPVTTLDFYLECYGFQFVEFELGMSLWCHWF